MKSGAWQNAVFKSGLAMGGGFAAPRAGAEDDGAVIAGAERASDLTVDDADDPGLLDGPPAFRVDEAEGVALAGMPASPAAKDYG
jgi:hypothetical protein